MDASQIQQFNDLKPLTQILLTVGFVAVIILIGYFINRHT